MDTFVPALPAPKRRRRHSPQFKAEVLKACTESGNTIAGVARHYGLNANLVHKWRRNLTPGLSGCLPRSVLKPDPVVTQSALNCPATLSSTGQSLA